MHHSFGKRPKIMILGLFGFSPDHGFVNLVPGDDIGGGPNKFVWVRKKKDMMACNLEGIVSRPVTSMLHESCLAAAVMEG